MERLLVVDNSGYSNYASFLCNALSKTQNKYEVYYLTDKYNGFLDILSKKVITSTAIRVGDRKLKRRSPQWYLDRLFGSFKTIASKKKEIARIAPAVIVFQYLAPIYDQYLLKRYKKSSKIVFTVHNVVPHEKTIYWSLRSLKRVYDLCDHLVVHSEENRQELIRDFKIPSDKITIINHGVSFDFEHIDVIDEKRKLGISDTKPVLLAYGGIRDYKGIDILIQACKGIDCHLIIAGATVGDVNFGDYEKLIKENNIDAICLNRFITNEESNILFQVADFIMLPYKEFHSQSGVFMQAIQYGKRVVASDVSSFRSFVEQFHLGLICKPNDIGSLHDTILQAIKASTQSQNNDELRRLFSWETSAEEYIKVIDSVNQ